MSNTLLLTSLRRRLCEVFIAAGWAAIISLASQGFLDFSASTILLRPSNITLGKNVSLPYDESSERVPTALQHGIRFYLYNGTDMAARPSELVREIGWWRDMFRPELHAEDMIHALLERHPHRAADAGQADVFIVPTPVGKYSTYKERRNLYKRAFSMLTKSPIFRSTGGNRHAVLALLDYHPHKVREFKHWFQKLANVTIVRSEDTNPCRDLARSGKMAGHDYEDLFVQYRWHTRTACYGLPPEYGLPLISATYEKFHNSSLFLFYRTRSEPSKYNSTRFRHAPLALINGTLPQSSIGHDLPRNQWLRDMTDAKFCPVIRGDTPHSHALFTAIRVGCIPVVVSDYYPVYAPPFKSSLNMRDFCVFIDEEAFIQDPAGRLGDLLKLSETDVRKKLSSLALAQRVLMLDHPETLFVEAFVKEVVASQKQFPSS